MRIGLIINPNGWHAAIAIETKIGWLADRLDRRRRTWSGDRRGTTVEL